MKRYSFWKFLWQLFLVWITGGLYGIYLICKYIYEH